MSFALTERQLLDGSKTQTRRLGWSTLRPGTLLCAVRKSQGIRKGEKVERLATIQVHAIRRERLDAIRRADVVAEGFPEMGPAEFVLMFCRHMGCEPDQLVTVITFENVTLRGVVFDRSLFDEKGLRPIFEMNPP